MKDLNKYACTARKHNLQTVTIRQLIGMLTDAERRDLLAWATLLAVEPDHLTPQNIILWSGWKTFIKREFPLIEENPIFFAISDVEQIHNSSLSAEAVISNSNTRIVFAPGRIRAKMMREQLAPATVMSRRASPQNFSGLGFGE
ncbi:hypothetical protein NG99_03255 [Erwinia typographi]|uniref:Uncharacterized protein n=1 Tax=Erwinia typographi TaxID=371042 RepID=A0A0A3Z906_9GAMM|nr:hypothetical protein [Erwinia typographi]KGT95532.1 hypothetical protein NG99_03255 [Erwinia typographi]